MDRAREELVAEALEGELLARQAEGYTGEIHLVVRMNQGGITTSDISATRRLPLKQ